MKRATWIGLTVSGGIFAVSTIVLIYLYINKVIRKIKAAKNAMDEIV